MKKLMTMMLGLGLLAGATSLFADDAKDTTTTTTKAKKTKKAKTPKKTAATSTEKKS
jgi:hypothetical protein